MGEPCAKKKAGILSGVAGKDLRFFNHSGCEPVDSAEDDMDAVGTLETGDLRWLPLRREMNRRERVDSVKEENIVLGYSASKMGSREMMRANTAGGPILQCLGNCISSSGPHSEL